MSKLKKRQNVLMRHLAKAGYSKSTLRKMRRCLRMAIEDGPRPEIKSYEDLLEYEAVKNGYSKDGIPYKQIKQTISLIWDFDVNGRFPHQDGKRSGFMRKTNYSSLNNTFKDIVDTHVGVCHKAGKKESTIYGERRESASFLAYLQKCGNADFSTLTPVTVRGYFYNGIKIIRGYKSYRVVRSMLNTAIQMGVPYADRVLSYLPRMRKETKMYDYMKPHETAKMYGILKSGGEDLTRMQVAMGWMLYFYGIRGVDIGRLRIQDIDWENERITMTQAKTGEPLSLPLTPVVGNAILDYIKEERPSAESDRVFLHKLFPNDRIGQTWYIVKGLYDAAGIRMDGEERGTRPMRHRLVSTLLTLNVDRAVVSSIVGHKDEKSIIPYVDVDMEHLRQCSLSIEAYPLDKSFFEV